MATDVVMPQMGESIAEGTITKWLVKVGDKVERDQPLFEISTDKVDAEIPAPPRACWPRSATRRARRCPWGRRVAVIGEAGEAAPARRRPPSRPRRPSPPPRPARRGSRPPRGQARRRRRRRPPAGAGQGRQRRRGGAGRAGWGRAPASRSRPSASGAREEAPAAAPAPTAAPATGRARPPRPAASRSGCASTRRRWCARWPQAEGVDLEQLAGSGIHGRVTKGDLETYLEERKRQPAGPRRGRPRRPRPRRRAPAAAGLAGRAASTSPPTSRARRWRSSRCRRSARSPRAHMVVLEAHLGARHHHVPLRHDAGDRGPQQGEGQVLRGARHQAHLHALHLRGDLRGAAQAQEAQRRDRRQERRLQEATSTSAWRWRWTAGSSCR